MRIDFKDGSRTGLVRTAACRERRFVITRADFISRCVCVNWGGLLEEIAMRAATCWMLSLVWLALWGATAANAAAPTDGKQPVKASSFAPHSSAGHSHVYGAPIQNPILRHRPKPKPQQPQLKSEPQLRSEPLPQG